MKRYISVINGKRYWYASGSLSVAKGRTLSKSTSLGRVETTNEELLALHEERFMRRLLLKEAEERTRHWKGGSLGSVARIEQLRTGLIEAKRQIGPQDAAFEMAFLIDFIYHSNRIEGSNVRREEVRRTALGEASSPEVVNTLQAKHFVDRKFRFTVASLVKLHNILLSPAPGAHGIRKEEIIVGDDATVHTPQSIVPSLEALFAWHKEHRHRMYPPELAFRFYFTFERIHPFLEGNGRIGRLLMNAILKDGGYHPIIIWSDMRAAHFSAFEAGAQGRIADFLAFMASQCERTYATYLERISPLDTDTRIDRFLSEE